MMKEMNKYMKRYNSYPVNIMNASKLTLRLYMALRRFHIAVRDNVSRRLVLSFTHYENTPMQYTGFSSVKNENFISKF